MIARGSYGPQRISVVGCHRRSVQYLLANISPVSIRYMWFRLGKYPRSQVCFAKNLKIGWCKWGFRIRVEDKNKEYLEQYHV